MWERQPEEPATLPLLLLLHPAALLAAAARCCCYCSPSVIFPPTMMRRQQAIFGDLARGTNVKAQKARNVQRRGAGEKSRSDVPAFKAVRMLECGHRAWSSVLRNGWHSPERVSKVATKIKRGDRTGGRTMLKKNTYGWLRRIGRCGRACVQGTVSPRLRPGGLLWPSHAANAAGSWPNPRPSQNVLFSIPLQKSVLSP